MQAQLDDREIISAVIYSFMAFIAMTFSVLVFFYYSRKKVLQKELEKKGLELEYQKNLLQATLLTQEEERNRIAQDLHDDISSKLNVISLNAHLLSEDLSKEESERITSNIITITSGVLESARRIAHDLLPPILDKLGLHAALNELCHSLNSHYLMVTYENESEQAFFETVDTRHHLHIYRIFQELINNSLRHGKATQIDITVRQYPEIRHIYYTDNGLGFSQDEVGAKSGIGMKNIESRAAFLGGRFEISSSPNEGVKAILSFQA